MSCQNDIARSAWQSALYTSTGFPRVGAEPKPSTRSPSWALRFPHRACAQSSVESSEASEASEAAGSGSGASQRLWGGGRRDRRGVCLWLFREAEEEEEEKDDNDAAGDGGDDDEEEEEGRGGGGAGGAGGGRIGEEEEERNDHGTNS